MADQACSDLHTPCPPGYLARHEWAEKMSETHRQVKCSGCGRWTIWVPKKEAPDGSK